MHYESHWNEINPLLHPNSTGSRQVPHCLHGFNPRLSGLN